MFILLSILPYILLSQSKSERVKGRLVELFELAKDDKYSDAASYIVYRGMDESRKWKDVYDYENAKDQEDVVNICSRIKTYLEIGGDYEFRKFKTETESEGEWFIWEVSFYKLEDKRVYFAFLKIKGKYCLGDID
jgi:hypothetical protein